MKTFFATTIAILLFTITCRAQNTFPVPSGNVGIGTTTPAGKLQIQNSSWDLLTGTSSLDIGVGGNTGGWARALRVVNTSGSDGTDGGAFGVKGSGTTPNFVYMAIPTTVGPVGHNSTKILALDNSGNVGIGTTNPFGKLDVKVATNQHIIFSNNTNGTFTNSSGIVCLNDANTSYTPLGFFAAYYYFGGGNIGIGTQSPDSKLTVNGKVHSAEVLVDLLVTPPDYVFKKNYNLPSLAYVEAYAGKNHHLPDVPAAAEMKKNGINVGEMNMTLLKKVEEITLYMIELNKTVKELQKKLSG